MVCQSCVVEIPDCPALCEKCQDVSSTTEDTTTTEEPEIRDERSRDGVARRQDQDTFAQEPAIENQLLLYMHM